MLLAGQTHHALTAIGGSFGRHSGHKSHRWVDSPPSFGKMLPVSENGDMQRGHYEGPQQRLFAVRGAAQAEANEPAAILRATEELMRGLIERNRLEPEAMVSCLFTTT
jgi:hypothetical protein